MHFIEVKKKFIIIQKNSSINLINPQTNLGIIESLPLFAIHFLGYGNPVLSNPLNKENMNLIHL